MAIESTGIYNTGGERFRFQRFIGSNGLRRPRRTPSPRRPDAYAYAGTGRRKPSRTRSITLPFAFGERTWHIYGGSQRSVCLRATACLQQKTQRATAGHYEGNWVSGHSAAREKQRGATGLSNQANIKTTALTEKAPNTVKARSATRAAIWTAFTIGKREHITINTAKRYSPGTGTTWFIQERAEARSTRIEASRIASAS